MDVQVNLLAVTLAMMSSLVVGSIWYAPSVFGKVWMKLTRQENRKGGGSVWKPIAVTAVVSLLTAYVLAHVIFLAHQFFQQSFLQDALSTAFWLWLGFVAARFVTHDAFEGRPAKLTLLNSAHELVTLEIMALIIGWMGV
jgi:hypothetical protein